MLGNFLIFLLNLGLVELKNAKKERLVKRLREREKGVFTSGHPRNPFQGKYPRG